MDIGLGRDIGRGSGISWEGDTGRGRDTEMEKETIGEGTVYWKGKEYFF